MYFGHQYFEIGHIRPERSGKYYLGSNVQRIFRTPWHLYFRRLDLNILHEVFQNDFCWHPIISKQGYFKTNNAF